MARAAAVVVFALLAVALASDVITGTTKNFKPKVLDNDELVIVEFFAPWCGHCQRLAPEWEKAATNLKGMVSLVAVDATVDSSLASQYGVQGYPTIKVFAPGKKKNPEDYQGARTAKAIVDYAVSRMPSSVKSLTDVSADDFLAPGAKGKVILFTSKSTTTPLYKALSNKFKKVFDFGEARPAAKKTVEKFGIETFPTLLLLTAGSSEPIKYDGELNLEKLAKWVSGHAGEAPADDSSAEAEAPAEKPKKAAAPPPPPKAKPVVGVHELAGATEGDYTLASLCTGQSGVCVFAFLDGNSDSCDKAEREAAVNKEHLAAFTEVATKFAKDPFAFSWVDAKKQAGFAAGFGVSGTPTVVAVKQGKKPRYTTLAGDFTAQNINALLDRIVGGDAKYTNLAEFPALVNNC